jgi:hypothetical protein
MSGRLLDFSQYTGGADNVKVIEMFPKDQKSFTYNFGSNVSTYSFTADYQSILLDTVTYDRNTGLPNFTDTSVLGYFTNTANVDVGNFNTTNANSGVVVFTIPADRYTGNVVPNARENVVATVLSFQWEIPAAGGTLLQRDRHRWCILERFDPTVGKVPADPALETNYVPLGVGAITGISNSGADALRANGTYSGVTGLSNKEGTGAIFQVVVAPSTGAATAKISARGTGYNVNDTITILDSQLGGGGAADLVITVTSVA